MTKFTKRNVLQSALNKLVVKQIEPFRTRGRVLIVIKALFFITIAIMSYGLLVFTDPSFSLSVFYSSFLALSVIGIAFNIQHDANHGAFSNHRWLNLLAGHSLDLIGASSYFWKNKHNTNHHTYTNIPQQDPDIELQPLARMAPDHEWRWHHRYQHLYMWVLYSFVHLRYLVSDPQRMFFGKRDDKSLRSPEDVDFWLMLVGKVIFLILAFVVPLIFHHWYLVIGYYVAISMVVGVIFSVVFQLAHSVDIVSHPSAEDDFTQEEWMIQQIQTTANFATNNWLVTFMLGGLNFQREHHLFPRVAHLHYPAIAKTVKAFCKKHNVVVHEHKTLLAALKSHYRFLKTMGQKPEQVILSPVQAT